MDNRLQIGSKLVFDTDPELTDLDRRLGVMKIERDDARLCATEKDLEFICNIASRADTINVSLPLL